MVERAGSSDPAARVAERTARGSGDPTPSTQPPADELAEWLIAAAGGVDSNEPARASAAATEHIDRTRGAAAL
eukprot:636308-Alexandrium_andersonii.AAC.1